MPMSPIDARLYANTWGSFVNNDDPGAYMYGFDDRFWVQTETHRANCLAWIADCRKIVETTPGDYEADELDQMDAFVEALKAAPCEADYEPLEGFTRGYFRRFYARSA